MAKQYEITITRSRHSGETVRKTDPMTVEELVKYFSYTLEKGASWQHEKGNKKINRNPKTIASLITNINNAENNAAANGWANTHYSLS